MSKASYTTVGPTTGKLLVASVGFVAGTVIGPKLVRWYRSYRKRRCERRCIYLDYNGTTPVYPDVLEAMMPYLTTHYGNPNSPHAYAEAPRAAIDFARSQILHGLLEAPDDTPLSSIVFTGCGTESDNLAIHMALLQALEVRKEGKQRSAPSSSSALPHVVTCNIEHPAIEACLRSLERQGRCTVTFVPVGSDGIVRASDVREAMTPDTALVTIMAANNEVGSVQPVAEIAALCRSAGVLFHTDAAQAAGKIPVTLRALGDPDMVSLVGHKLGAPKGVACLYVNPATLSPSAANASALLIGGGQEGGRRAGTQNTPYIVGMGTAAARAALHLARNATHMRALRYLLLRTLQDELGPDLVRPNGPAESSLLLPNTLSVGLRGVHSGKLIQTIGDRVAASAGATCHSTEDALVSGVLEAMGVPLEFARGTLRLSLGPNTSARDVTLAASIIAQAVKKQLNLAAS